jgi:hypothetical protein
VAEGVFDDGLEDEVGDGRVEGARIYVHPGGEAVAEADALDFEVAGEELQLLLERDFLRAGVLQGEAEEVAEPRDHAVGALRVGVDEGRNRVQRVKEEVGLELHLQGLQLRVRELRFELRGAQLALARAPVVAEGRVQHEEQAVDAIILRRVEDNPLERRARRVGSAGDVEEVVDDVEGAGDGDDEEGGEEDVEEEVAPPAAALDGEAPGEPEHDDRADGPEVRVDELLRGGRAPRPGPVAEEAGVIELAGEEEGQRRPAAEDGRPAHPAPPPPARVAGRAARARKFASRHFRLRHFRR